MKAPKLGRVQRGILNAIYWAPGITVGRLTETHGTWNQREAIVEGLVARGYVAVQRDTVDHDDHDLGVCYQLHITDAGEEALRYYGPIQPPRVFTLEDAA